MYLTKNKVSVDVNAEPLFTRKENQNPSVETKKCTPWTPARLSVRAPMISLLQSPADDIVSIRAFLRRSSAKNRCDKHDGIRGKETQEVWVFNQMRLPR